MHWYGVAKHVKYWIMQSIYKCQMILNPIHPPLFDSGLVRCLLIPLLPVQVLVFQRQWQISTRATWQPPGCRAARGGMYGRSREKRTLCNICAGGFLPLVCTSHQWLHVNVWVRAGADGGERGGRLATGLLTEAEESHSKNLFVQ